VKLAISFSFILSLFSACGTAQPKKEIFFFQGRGDDRCRYLGYVHSGAEESSRPKSYESARAKLVKQAQDMLGNCVHVVNYNMALNFVGLAAEVYYCPPGVSLSVDKSDNPMTFDLEQ